MKRKVGRLDITISSRGDIEVQLTSLDIMNNTLLLS